MEPRMAQTRPPTSMAKILVGEAVVRGGGFFSRERWLAIGAAAIELALFIRDRVGRHRRFIEETFPTDLYGER